MSVILAGHANLPGVAARAKLPSPLAGPGVTRRARLEGAVPTSFRGPILAGAAIIAVFFVGLGGWAAIAELSSAAVAPGTVIVDGKHKVIQHLEGGIVREILVHDSDRVTAGQVLLRLDDTQPRAKLQLLTGRYYGALALAARLQAEASDATELHFPETLLQYREDAEADKRMTAERTIFKARLDELDSQIKILIQRDVQLAEEVKGHEGQIAASGRQLSLIADEITVVNDLLVRGLALKPRLLLLQRQSAEIGGQRSQSLAAIARARQTMADTRLRIAELHTSRRNDALKQLGDTQKDLFDLVEQLRTAHDQVDRLEVKSPEDGVVVNLAVNTAGGVIGAGQALMEVVPSLDRLVIDAHVEMNDIDKVVAGSPAQVTLLAYSRRTTPAVSGKVVWVSPDRIETDKLHMPYYAARVEVDEKELAGLGNVRLYPGMQVQVMVATEKRTMLDYIAAPLTRSFSRAFHEQ